MNIEWSTVLRVLYCHIEHGPQYRIEVLYNEQRDCYFVKCWTMEMFELAIPSFEQSSPDDSRVAHHTILMEADGFPVDEAATFTSIDEAVNAVREAIKSHWHV